LSDALGGPTERLWGIGHLGDLLRDERGMLRCLSGKRPDLQGMVVVALVAAAST
jgi:hypothetical protein